MDKLLKNIIVLLASIKILALLSCTTEPDRFIYKVLVTNLSGNDVEMSLFSEGQLVESLILESAEQYVWLFVVGQRPSVKRCFFLRSQSSNSS